jgi:dTDP-4-amino-4,6-dideoxygalactose transaminase/nucleoside-diphosphate-sugar epimerase
MRSGGATAPTAPRVERIARRGARREWGQYIVLGGAGFVGSRAAAILRRHGARVVVVDRNPPPRELTQTGVAWIDRDVLLDDVELPEGHVLVSLGSGNPRPRWTWTLPLEVALTTARIAPQLAGRDVTLVSSIEVYGRAGGPLAEHVSPVLPWGFDVLDRWCEDAMAAAAGPCPPWRVARLCRSLADGDPSGRWVYGAAKLIQEAVVRATVPDHRLTVLRLANTFGIGQERLVVRLTRRALAGRELRVTSSVRSFLPVEDVARVVLAALGPGTFNVGGRPVRLTELAGAIREVCRSDAPIDIVAPPSDDSCGQVDTSRLAAAGLAVGDVFAALPRLARALAASPPLFSSSLPVIVPPRPARPDELADRQQAALWSGRTKAGNRWSRELARGLAERLEVEDQRLLVTTSGTDALRLAVVATVGPARPGEAAAVPSFTFPATAEAVAQLGYKVRFVDVDPQTWTMDPADLERVIAESAVRVAVVVDTFGNPADYDGLRAICRDRDVALVADSAAALGSRHAGRPIGHQADAHAFSTSFAKALTAGGAGGAVVVPAGTDLGHWTRSKLMDELHAVSALDQLAVFDDLLERRAAIARVYAEAVERFPQAQIQGVRRGNCHSHVHWVLRVPAAVRAPLMAALGELGIGTRDYFRALHRIGWRSDRLLPVTERLHTEVVALPMSSELTIEDADLVAVGIDCALRRTLAHHDEQRADIVEHVLMAPPTLKVERDVAIPLKTGEQAR